MRQQRPALAVQDLAALGGAGVVGQHVEGHHPVAQPAPDQRRQHQHQRRHQPQRHAEHQRQQRQQRCRPATRSALPAPGRAALALQRRKAPPHHQVATMAGVISQATSSSDSTTITGTASATTISGASTVRQLLAAHRFQPLQQRGHQRPAPAWCARRPPPAPSRTSPGRTRPTGHQQRQQRPQQRSPWGAGSRPRAPEGVDSWGLPHLAARISPRRASARPARRFRPSHCWAQKPRP
jgi:hypothetical protein